MNQVIRIDRLAIIGVGLIGGSFALAVKQAGAVREVLGVGRSAANLALARQHGLIDRAVDVAEAAHADCILLAMPVGETTSVLTQLMPHLKAGAVITDAGSTKANVLAAARTSLGERFSDFVPGHPIAGSECNGPLAARADLFQDRKVVLTPTAETRPDAQKLVTALWSVTGAQVEMLDAKSHDRIFAAVSHLPHLAAYALVNELAQRENSEEFFRFAASGFRDFTRIAGSSPEMWRDIALENRGALLTEMDAYIAALQRLRVAMEAGDDQTLLKVFSQARRAREHWLSK